MQVRSKVAQEIDIEHVDWETGPERFVVRAGSLSYTVLPSSGCLTSGDIEAVTYCPPPVAATNGSVVRIVSVYDETAAALSPWPKGGKRVWFLAVVKSADGALASDTYFDLLTFGSAAPVKPSNDANPQFIGVYEDVTAEFVASAEADQLQARIDIGPVFHRICVDADGSRYAGYGEEAGIRFVDTIAPALDDLSKREVVGLLVEAGFRTFEEFRASEFKPHSQTASEAAALLSLPHVQLSRPAPEALDYHRLHTDWQVQEECYREMRDAASEAFAALPLPISLRREPVATVSMASMAM